MKDPTPSYSFSVRAATETAQPTYGKRGGEGRRGGWKNERLGVRFLSPFFLSVVLTSWMPTSTRAATTRVAAGPDRAPMWGAIAAGATGRAGARGRARRGGGRGRRRCVCAGGAGRMRGREGRGKEGGVRGEWAPLLRHRKEGPTRGPTTRASRPLTNLRASLHHKVTHDPQNRPPTTTLPLCFSLALSLSFCPRFIKTGPSTGRTRRCSPPRSPRCCPVCGASA